MEIIRVRSEAEAAGAIAAAAAEGLVLELKSNGTKRGLGRLMNVFAVLDLSGLAGITSYEPDELVICVRPGTPLNEIEVELASRGQMLAFEPPDFARFYGASARSTIGGIVGTNASGPRRFKAGAARDHVLGLNAINGMGEVLRTGGRVVKNVTGYDLPKLLTGSYGTLAAFSEITLKVFPMPETEATMILRDLSEGQGLSLLREVAGLTLEATGLVHATAAVGAGRATFKHEARSFTCVRIEGARESVEARIQALIKRVQRIDHLVWRSGASRALWASIRDLDDFAGTGGPVWRLSIPPAAAEEVANAIGARLALFDWAGGLITLQADATPSADTALIRAAIARHGGHATLLRAATPVRKSVPVFEPLSEEVFALTRRVKEAFDPKGIFNPGRMHQGI